MTILLAGDIGGTKTILRLVQSAAHKPDRETAHQPPEQTTLYQQRYASQSFTHLIPMVKKFLISASSQLGSQAVPEKACFAISGPVVRNRCKLTNLNWSLDIRSLEQALQIAPIALINDFAAIGHGVLGLSDQDLHTLQPAHLDAHAPIAVIGAGTGLGQGFLIPDHKGYQVFSTEGGHADFAPRLAIEFQLSQYLLETHHIDRVSAEQVVSGMGIVSIYQFLRSRKPAEESAAMTTIFKAWKQEIGQEKKTIDLAAAISKTAIQKQDNLCGKTMELFVQAYGAEAGNLALKLLPYGGLYIAGGIAAKILPLLHPLFLEAFVAKGRMQPLLEQIPVHVILNKEVGLIGAALCAVQL